MTKLKFYSKSQEYDYATGKSSFTKIILGNDDGAFYPVFLDAANIDLDNAELEVLALSKVYEDNFPNKANNDKFDAIGEALKKIDDKMKEVNDKLEETEQVNQQTIQMASENRIKVGNIEKSLADKIKKAVAEAVKAELAKKAEGEA